jgi:hypothetical protein
MFYGGKTMRNTSLNMAEAYIELRSNMTQKMLINELRNTRRIANLGNNHYEVLSTDGNYKHKLHEDIETAEVICEAMECFARRGKCWAAKRVEQKIQETRRNLK